MISAHAPGYGTLRLQRLNCNAYGGQEAVASGEAQNLARVAVVNQSNHDELRQITVVNQTSHDVVHQTSHNETRELADRSHDATAAAQSLLGPSMSNGQTNHTMMPQATSQAKGLPVRIMSNGVGIADGELFAYRPADCQDLSRLVTFCDDGTELFQLPPLWMVVRPDECPLVWIVLHSSASMPPNWAAGSTMQVEWAAPQGPAPNWVGCTVAGEAPHEAVLGVDEGLLRAEAMPGKQLAEQVRLLLNPQSGRILCRWLRHAQQVGILI